MTGVPFDGPRNPGCAWRALRVAVALLLYTATRILGDGRA